MAHVFTLGKRIGPIKLVAILAISVGALLAANCAQALIASPARIEIEGDPGEKVNGKLSLVNNQDDTITYFSSFENFEAQDETGVPRFVDSDDDLATWITVNKQIILEPGERREIPFSVDVPMDAGVGGHFSAIFWGTTPPDTDAGEIGVGAKVGILLFLRVSGDVVEKGEIIEFHSLTEKKFFDSLPVDMLYRFENSGNDRTKPAGELVIKNTLGKEVEKIEANKKLGSVLPESVRKFYVSWGREDMDNIEKKLEDGTLYPEQAFFEKAVAQISNFALGRYSAELNLKYGEQEKTAQAQFNFWIIPWQLLSVVAAILFVILFGGKIMLRRYNKRVIASAQKAQNQKKDK